MEMLDFNNIDVLFKFLYSLIKEEAIIVVPFLWVIGTFLKNTLFIKDKYIPLILLCIGISTSVVILGFNIQAIIQGVFVSGTAVFGHQLLKQRKKEE